MNNNENEQPSQEGNPPRMQQQDQEQNSLPNTLREPNQPGSSFGPLIGMIIVIALLLAAGFYFFNERWDNRAQEEIPTATTTDPQTEALEQQSSSDELDAIENDLNNTSLEDVDRELDQIDQELDVQ